MTPGGISAEVVRRYPKPISTGGYSLGGAVRCHTALYFACKSPKMNFHRAARKGVTLFPYLRARHSLNIPPFSCAQNGEVDKISLGKNNNKRRCNKRGVSRLRKAQKSSCAEHQGTRFSVTWLAFTRKFSILVYLQPSTSVLQFFNSRRTARYHYRFVNDG